MIFVHGLGGDAFSTWRHGKDDSGSWPYWLGQEFPDIGVWSLGYAASPTKWTRILGWFLSRWRDSGYTMALPDRALEVLNLMELRGLGQRPLLFICHSLGGLLAKQILRRASDSNDPGKNRVVANTRGILFLATPHTGADLASSIDSFSSVFGATVSIEDLRAHDAHLRDLYDWYRNHALEIETVTYYEMRPVGGVLPIVMPAFAHPGIGADPVPLDEDHISIAKLRSRDAQVYGAARDLLANNVLTNKPGRQSPPRFSSTSESRREPQELTIKLDASAVSAREARIPHELPPAAQAFFGRPTELTQLSARLREAKNTAVVGPAGLGKTALAARALHEVVGDSPAALAGSPFPDGVVFLDLYALRGQCEPAWNSLANKLAGAGFMERSPARERATQACIARRILITIEGGEEADGNDDRCAIDELLSVLSPQNRRLLLTRLSTQAARSETVELKEALQPGDAADLLDLLTGTRLSGAVRERLLELLEGHPLALTWAGNLVALDDDDPKRLVDDWSRDHLPKLSDPTQARRTLEWLFERSVRGLDNSAQQVLAAAGLLARASFPLAAMRAALADGEAAHDQTTRDALKSLAHRGFLRRLSDEPDHWEFTHVLGYRFARKEKGTDHELRERLAIWLRERLRAALETSPSGDDVLSLARLLQHAGALLRADDDQRLWMPLANYLLYDARDRLVDLGRLDIVKLDLNGVADWMERFPAAKSREPEWLRESSVLLNRRGDVLRDQGDLAGAVAAFRESLAVSQRLAASDPSNAGWQRDLSVSQERIGDVLRAQGDLAGALAAFRGSLAVRQRPAASDPSNAGWQRDLSVSQERIGAVLRAQGDLAGALAAFRGSLAVRQRLAASDPSNAGWQRDLSVSQERIGDVLHAQGDLAGALAAFRESLAGRQGLAASDPSNAGWQRDLSVSHNKVGDVLRDQGDLAGALAAFRESLAVRQRLAASDPSNAGWQRDQSVSQERIGDVLRAQGDLAGAVAAFRESLAVSQRLAASDPSNAGWQRDLSVSHNKVGDVLRDQGDLAGALAAFRESLAVSQRLAAADPRNAGWQRDLSFSLTQLAEFHDKEGDADEALRFAEESRKIDERLAALDTTNATWQHDVAVSRALVARLQVAKTS